MSCSICLETKGDLILWHLPVAITHAKHASCVSCISTEILQRINAKQTIKCPSCRAICLIQPSKSKETSSSYNLFFSSISTIVILAIRYLFADMSAFFLKYHENTLVSFDTDQWIHLSANMDFFGFKDFRSHRIKEAMSEHLADGKKDEIISYISEQITLKHISAIYMSCIASIGLVFVMARNYPLKSSLKGALEQFFHYALNLWIIHYFKTDCSDYINCTDSECDPYTPPFYNAKKANKNAVELFLLFAVAIVMFVIKLNQINQEQEINMSMRVGNLSFEEIKTLFNRKKITLSAANYYEI